MKRIVTTLSLLLCVNAYATTETVNWYADDSVHTTTTCTIGGDVTLPSAPTKRGHTFDGWNFGYDFSTLDATVDGTSYSISGRYNWTVTFPYGTIYGTSACANMYRSNLDSAATLNISEDSSLNMTCWCRVTGYQPSGSNITYVPYQTLLWATTGHNAYGNTTSCNNNCKTFCAGTSGYGNVMNSAAYRRALFGITN